MEVVESTASAVARPASRLARWLPLVLRPLLGAFLLAAALFVVQASSVVPGFAPQTALACNLTSWDGWESSNTANASWSNTRTVDWYATFTGCAWIYGWHAASVDGGVTWYATPGTVNSGTIRVTPNHSWTANADGHATSLLASAPAYRSCVYAATVASDGHITTWNQTNGAGNTCSNNWAVGTFNNDLIIDTTGPGTPSVTYPTSTLYTTATGGTVTWSAVGDTYSGTQGYYVNYHWATLSNGSCVSQGGDSGWGWVGNTTSWGPGWGANTCFQFQVVAKDNLNNWGGASGWSAWIGSDQVPTTNSTTVSIGAANYANTAFNVNWSATDSGSGVSDAATYIWTMPSTDGNGNCTGAASGATNLSGAFSGTVSSGFTNGTCARWETQSHDRAGNLAGGPYTQWVMFDNVAPVWHGFTAPVGNTNTLGAWRGSSPSSYTFAWNAATDAASGLSATPYPGWLQSSPLVGGVCGTADQGTNLGSLSTPSYAATNLTSGRCYRVAIEAFDKAGNYAPSGNWYNSAWVGVDLAAPSIAFTAPTGTAWIRSTTQAVAWNETATPSGIRDRAIYIQVAPKTAGTCGTYSQGTSMGGGSPQTFTGLGEGYCYGWAGWITSNAGVTGSSGGMTSGIVKVDLTAPVITFTSPVASMQATTSITAAWTESDAGAGVNAGSRSVQRQKAGIASPGVCSATWANDGAATSTASPRTDSGLADAYCYRYQATLADLVGNSATATSGVVLIDTTAPSITASLAGTAGSNGWYVSSVTVTVTASDAQSGVSVQYSIDGGAWTAYLSPFVVNGDLSSHRVDYRATNGAGTTVSGSNSPIKIDATNPTSLLNLTGTAGLNGWWRSVLTATPTGTDATSGIWTVYYRVDGGAWTNTTTSPVVVISVDGTHTVDWYALDLAGNQETTQTQTIKIDTIAPTGTLTLVDDSAVTRPSPEPSASPSPLGDDSGVTHSRFITASVTMADAGSGPGQVRFSTDGGSSWTAWTAYVVTPTITPLTLASWAGTYTVSAQIQDLAGNVTSLGHSISLLNEVIPPRFGAAAKIYDCTTNALLATNTTGTIYWPVDLDLCLVPTARLVTNGSDGTNSPTLVGTISDPPTIVPYTLHAADKGEMDKAPVKWPNTGFYPVGSDPLRFTFGRETSSLSTPYITVPYDAVVTVVWSDGTTTRSDPPFTVPLNLRIVVKNIGTTGTH